MPLDPRSATGMCASLGQGAVYFTPPFQPYQTGGPGAGPIPSSAADAYAWPPTTIQAAGPVTDLPYYTVTASVPTLPAPTFNTAEATGSYSAGDGWYNSQDPPAGYVPISTCSYPDPWLGVFAAVPTAPCGPGLQKREPIPEPGPTPPPVS
jgi:glucan 1,3-beta-glucosidase